MWYNYHCHSNYCDGVGSLEKYVQAAIDKQFKSIGFSSHTPLWFENSWSMSLERLDDYLHEIKQLKLKYAERIEIYSALEIDYIEGREEWIDQLLEKKLDYAIFSVHFLSGPSGKLVEIDGPTDMLLNQLEVEWKNDRDVFVKQYFRAVEMMVKSCRPTIVGHLDKIRMHSYSNGETLFDIDSDVYKNASESALKTIKASGSFLEINTRGLYKKKLSHPYPSPILLRRAKELDIPLVLNSDAHHPDELDSGFSEALELLFELEIKKLKVFVQGVWMDATVTPNGLIPDHG